MFNDFLLYLSLMLHCSICLMLNYLTLQYLMLHNFEDSLCDNALINVQLYDVALFQYSILCCYSIRS